MEGAPLAEMHASGNGGGDTHFTCVPSCLRSRNFPDLGLEVGVEIRDLRQGAGTQSGIAGGIEFSVRNTCRCAMPTLLAALPPQFKQLHARSSCTLATVRYTCVQKGGGSMCALQGARRTGAFERPEADEFVRPVPARRARPRPRSPSLAAISPSSEGLSGAHHADKMNFSGRGSPQDFLAQCIVSQTTTSRDRAGL